MSQFDVFKVGGGVYPLVVDVQADLLAQLDSRVVVPLARRDRYPPPHARVTPTVTIEGVVYVLVVPLVSAVARSSLGEPIASLAAHRSDVIAALDLLFTGS